MRRFVSLVPIVLSACCNYELFGEDDVEYAPVPGEQRDQRPREVIESEIYALEGTQLYVYNYTLGLYAIDVADPGVPAVRAFAPVPGGARGELYVRGDEVLVLLESAAPDCAGAGALLILRDLGTDFELASHSCLAGALVASRLLDALLYVVTADGAQSTVASLDVGDAEAPTVADALTLPGEAHEIYLDTEALFVARRELADDYTTDTRLSRFDITNPTGDIVASGSTLLRGAPQGRFHMDAAPGTFRIVTFDERQWESVLYVLDTSSDGLGTLGELRGIGEGEQLYATRFVDDRAYVVTFRQTDPLWVVDLHDPSAPTIVGELRVPGWSDFIFPRGDTLLTVGRGASFGVAVALFDVADPTSPRQLSTVELGGWDGGSEANLDHRGVTILEPGRLGADGLVAIGTAGEVWTDSDYFCATALHLVDLGPERLALRGTLPADGAVRRSFAIGDRLYVIADHEVLSVDVSDRDHPTVDSGVSVGDPSRSVNACADAELEPRWGDDHFGSDYCGVGCQAVGGTSWGLVALGWLLRRRRPRTIRRRP